MLKLERCIDTLKMRLAAVDTIAKYDNQIRVAIDDHRDLRTTGTAGDW